MARTCSPRRFACASLASPSRGDRPQSDFLSNAGFTIVEIVISVALLAAFAVGSIEALLTLNRNASSTRIISCAREVVQRNMEAAMTVPFSSSSIPPILNVTTGTGWNETNDVVLGTAAIPLIVARDGTVFSTGTLKRTVALATTAGFHPDTRRVTFTLSYFVNGRPKPDYTLTSMRSPDK